ncbi:asparagine synthase C-terminal domain-containing protein [Natronoarchaeum philippinense]|uniref:asparagine synthase C-terminal domain-containing protein n=1 Tax=Natronoarchaeum philippinense TaxID=558529 RepID=UPI000BE386C8|nr:asparagine synthase-related protein [Natronoarchaeum philippinense]
MQGADPAVVRRALDDAEPLPGTAGFAGVLAAEQSDGHDTLVRDVLGRYPLFVDDYTGEHAASPSTLDEPRSVPAGHVRRLDGDDAKFQQRWALPEPAPMEDERAAVADLQAAIRTGVDAAASAASGTTDPDADIAVAFSGGVDSAVVAAGLDAAGVDAPLYAGGFPGSHDLGAARSAAHAMDRELRVVEFTVADIERAVPEVARAIDRPDAMAVQIALPLYLVAERAAVDGYDHLAVGQGADELFGGYAKIARAPDDPRVDADTVRGARDELLGTLPSQLERDVLALRGAGAEPVAPLLHDAVVGAALRLPGDALVDARGERKRAFRLAAREFVPDRVAFREKKAVQYGSLAARELDRLAREAGFKRTMDDHVTEYVRSRIDG